MIYVDTGPLLARYLRHDQYHQRAAKGWRELATGQKPCYTSNFVLDETFTLLARRSTYSFAAERARNLLSSQVLIVLRPTDEDEWEAVDLFEKFADQAVSFTDCISFVLMHKNNLRRAFSFDLHFEYAGFELWP